MTGFRKRSKSIFNHDSNEKKTATNNSNATLSGRDTQSEMEAETSREAQALTLECSQHRARLYY